MDSGARENGSSGVGSGGSRAVSRRRDVTAAAAAINTAPVQVIIQ
jgi:hypothetical protein